VVEVVLGCVGRLSSALRVVTLALLKTDYILGRQNHVYLCTCVCVGVVQERLNCCSVSAVCMITAEGFGATQ
jgi:hypothetical protein